MTTGYQTMKNLPPGAGDHMCGYKNMFTEIEDIVDGHMLFRDASKVKVKGLGKILIQCRDGNERFISKVYCPLYSE